MNEQQTTESSAVPFEASDRDEMWPGQISLVIVVCLIFVILAGVILTRRRPKSDGN
jgi:hypothetical protein